jgi:hypothetical protein
LLALRLWACQFRSRKDVLLSHPPASRQRIYSALATTLPQSQGEYCRLIHIYRIRRGSVIHSAKDVRFRTDIAEPKLYAVSCPLMSSGADS